jgi:hypothetical protein
MCHWKKARRNIDRIEKCGDVVPDSQNYLKAILTKHCAHLNPSTGSLI